MLTQALENPESLTDQQRRELTGKYLNEEEKKEAERKRQIIKNGYKAVDELGKDVNKSIERNNIKIDEINEKIKVEPVLQKKQILENEKQQLEQQNIKNKKILEEKVKPYDRERELERQKLVKLEKISPELAKDSIKKHFELNIDRYKEIYAKDPNFKGLDEMYELVKKADLEKELGIEKETAEYQKTKASKSSNIEQNPKTINNPQDPILSAQEKYGKGNIPPEVKNNIAEKKIIGLGYEKDVKVIKGKLPAVQISPKSNQIDKPYPTPAMAKFAARAEAMNKKNTGREM